MTEKRHTDRISIQVGLSGYSFKVHTSETDRCSGWSRLDEVFTSPYLQREYDEVEISVFTPKCALVPEGFHSPDVSSACLEDVAQISDTDVVEHVPVPQYGSVLVFSNSIGESLSDVLVRMVRRTDGTQARPLPELYFMLQKLASLDEYNKIMASYMDGRLYLTVAQGASLLLCNSYEAMDFTTAQYYIFMVMKKLQLNPELSTIYFRTPLEEEQELSLYHYFRNVEKI